MAETSDGKRNTSASGGDEGPKTDEGTAAAICPVAFCPICATISVVNRASPEVVDHLLSAAREFLLAARAVVDARAADYEGDEPNDRTLHRIDIR
ncbi:MAG TPA: hypothetical protein VK962_03355 [Actinomycetota bacterium]|nr:hypothetical protein [Actinomycetota bacterium]